MTRLFVDELARIDARPEWTNPQGGSGAAPVAPLTLDWPESGGRRTWVTLGVVTGRQRLGGVRRWWRCPSCGRRCGVVFALDPDTPFRCRRCWGAVYRCDYPAGEHLRRYLEVTGWLPDRYDGMRDELARLTARRRRGVRRGRRVLERAARLTLKLHHAYADFPQQAERVIAEAARPLRPRPRKQTSRGRARQ